MQEPRDIAVQEDTFEPINGQDELPPRGPADHLTAYLKGDRIKVRGFFRTRTYTKGGEENVVTAASLEKMKVREEALAPAPKTRKKDRAA